MGGDGLNIERVRLRTVALKALKSDSSLKCSPYQAVTRKIYGLKQHFLPPVAA